MIELFLVAHLYALLAAPVIIPVVSPIVIAIISPTVSPVDTDFSTIDAAPLATAVSSNESIDPASAI